MCCPDHHPKWLQPACLGAQLDQVLSAPEVLRLIESWAVTWDAKSCICFCALVPAHSLFASFPLRSLPVSSPPNAALGTDLPYRTVGRRPVQRFPVGRVAYRCVCGVACSVRKAQSVGGSCCRADCGHYFNYNGDYVQHDSIGAGSYVVNREVEMLRWLQGEIGVRSGCT